MLPPASYHDGVAESAHLILALREAAAISSSVATHCDRSAHNEATAGSTLTTAGARLRDLATFLARALEIDLLQAYGRRLEAVEGRSPYEPLLPRPPDRLAHARTWRDIQLVQLAHDRHYHPDVFGLGKSEQVVHIALHLCKLTGAIARLSEEDPSELADFARRRLPDLLLFGVKLSTVAGESLAGSIDDQFERNAGVDSGVHHGGRGDGHT